MTIPKQNWNHYSKVYVNTSNPRQLRWRSLCKLGCATRATAPEQLSQIKFLNYCLQLNFLRQEELSVVILSSDHIYMIFIFSNAVGINSFDYIWFSIL